ncbi:peptidyl-prolyl cis-trans isomerase [Oceanicaulis sp. AH-315-P02]|nr:peptidyl-prolyl cis-trans isomerase [Oceanicaulis sp. AH-315-P02]
MFEMSISHWRKLALLFGIISGLAMAILASLNDKPQANQKLPPSALVMVDDGIILQADLVRALTAVSAGRRNLLTEGDEQAILQRLIDEELLLQRAIKLGLVEAEPELRNSLVAALTREVIIRSRSEAVDQQKLEEFYETNKQLFTQKPRYFVKAVFLENLKNLTEFETALANGDSIDTLVNNFTSTIPIPEGLLPKQKLVDYLGPQALADIDSMEIGTWSKVPDDQNVFWRIFLVDKVTETTLPRDIIEQQVLTAFKNQRDDQALRDYISNLRREAVITYQAESGK